MRKDISALLEVPDLTFRKDVEAFVKKYSYFIQTAMTPVPVGNKLIYFVQGPEDKYDTLDKAASKMKYRLWRDTKVQPFSK